MRLDRTSYWTVSVIGFLLYLLTPLIAPTVKLSFLIPSLVIIIYQKPLNKCLWYSFFTGLLIDLFFTAGQIGLNTVSYCLATIALFGQRKNLFPDHLTTLPIFTLLLSFTVTLVQMTMILLFDHSIHLSLIWLVTDLIIYPMFDGLYSIGIYLLPSLLIRKKTLHGSDYFLQKD